MNSGHVCRPVAEGFSLLSTGMRVRNAYRT
jgi:hypothetical protein